MGCQATWSPSQVPREDKPAGTLLVPEAKGRKPQPMGTLLLDLFLPPLPQQLEILSCRRCPPTPTPPTPTPPPPPEAAGSFPPAYSGVQ